MICLIMHKESHQIVSTNIHEEDGKFQLWATKPNGKTLKVQQSTVEEDINMLKDAIDYAIEIGETAFRIV